MPASTAMLGAKACPRPKTMNMIIVDKKTALRPIRFRKPLADQRSDDRAALGSSSRKPQQQSRGVVDVLEEDDGSWRVPGKLPGKRVSSSRMVWMGACSSTPRVDVSRPP